MFKNFKRNICGLLAGTLLVLSSTSAMAQRYHYGNSYHQSYYSHGHGGHDFVRGAIVGGVVTSLIYEANRNRPVYVNGGSAVYYNNPDPRWAPVYVQTYDPYCRCYVLVKQYQDPYGNYHSYP